MKNIIIIIFISCLISYLLSQTAENFPVLKGPYLGQNPPGIVPEVFAPGIVSDSTWAEH